MPSTISILSVAFNEDNSCLLCNTTQGFMVYTMSPFRCMLQRTIEGGVRLGRMYRQTNLFFLCGTGAALQYPINRVMVWDDLQKQTTAEISLNSRIESLEVSSRGLLVVASHHKVYLYSTDTVTLQESYEIQSPLLQTRLLDSGFRLAYSTRCCEKDRSGTFGISIRSPGRFQTVSLHQTPVRQISISHDGAWIATCSESGTLIRILHAETGIERDNFRRGNFSTRISFLGFSDTDKWVLCGTETGTLHGFPREEPNPSANTLWGLVRRRSAFHIKVVEAIRHAIFLEDTGTIYLITATKLYTAKVEGTTATLGKSVLLLHPKDPFTPSPSLPRKIPRIRSVSMSSATEQCARSL